MDEQKPTSDVVPQESKAWKRHSLLPLESRIEDVSVPKDLIEATPTTRETTLSDHVCRMLAWHVPQDVMIKSMRYFYGLEKDTQFDPYHMISRIKRTEKYKPLILKYTNQFNEDLKRIPIANKAYRLQILENVLGKALDQKRVSPHSVVSLLELASKEAGEFQPTSQINVQVNTYAQMVQAYEEELKDEPANSTSGKGTHAQDHPDKSSASGEILAVDVEVTEA